MLRGLNREENYQEKPSFLFMNFVENIFKHEKLGKHFTLPSLEFRTKIYTNSKKQVEILNQIRKIE